jgi:hypothetical protein
MTGLLGREALERRFRAVGDVDAELRGAVVTVVRWVRTAEGELLTMGGELITPSDLLPNDDVVEAGRFNEYGLDAGGHIVVARSRVPEADDLLVHEQITIERDGARLWATRFDLSIDRQVPLELWTYPDVVAHRPLVVESMSRFAGYSVVEFDEVAPEEGEPVSSRVLAEFLTRDLREALRGRELGARRWWIVWVHYTGETTHWIDAAWPTISAAMQGDRAAMASAAAIDGWRGGWRALDWTLPEYEVPLSPATQQALLGATGSAEALDECMYAVAAALRAEGEPATIYIAAAVDLERLGKAVESLPPEQRRELREVGLVPSHDDPRG